MDAMRWLGPWLVMIALSACADADDPLERPAELRPLAAPERRPADAGTPGRLLNALDSADAAAARGALRQLAARHPARLRADWPRLARTLGRALDRGRIAFGSELVELLERQGPRGLELQVRGLRAPDPALRRRVADNLVAAGDRGLRMLIAALDEVPATDRRPAETALEALEQAATAADPERRAEAAGLLWLLAEAGARAPGRGELLEIVSPVRAAAVRRLETLLDDDDALVRSAALEALGQLGPLAQGAAAAVAARLYDTEAGVVEVAGSVLPRFGTRAVGPLIQALGAKEPRLRVLAARGLARIAGDSPAPVARRTVAVLGARLRGAERRLRRVLYELLAELPAALGSSEPLARGLSDPEPALRLQVAAALGKRRDDPKAVAALAAALPGAAPRQAVALLQALARQGRRARPVFDALRRASRSDSAAVRRAAVRALEATDAGAKLVSALGERLDDADAGVRRAAVAALAERLPLAMRMRPHSRRLRRLAKRIRRLAHADPDPLVRGVCSKLLPRLPY